MRGKSYKDVAREKAIERARASAQTKRIIKANPAIKEKLDDYANGRWPQTDVKEVPF